MAFSHKVEMSGLCYIYDPCSAVMAELVMATIFQTARWASYPSCYQFRPIDSHTLVIGTTKMNDNGSFCCFQFSNMNVVEVLIGVSTSHRYAFVAVVKGPFLDHWGRIATGTHNAAASQWAAMAGKRFDIRTICRHWGIIITWFSQCIIGGRSPTRSV